MKKWIASAAAALLVLGGTTFSFAATVGEGASQTGEAATEAAAPVIRTVAGLGFTGPELELSLEDARAAAATSGAALKAAELKKQSDEANAKSNSETVSDMKDANNDENGNSSYSNSQIDQARMARDYYNTMAERNYEAALNKIDYDIYNAYYSLLSAEENVRIAEESLELQQSLLATTQKKFDLGVASKQDVLQTEMSVNNARVSLESAEVQLAQSKMELNEALGYDQMQEVRLTTELQMAEASELPLEQALSEALENRNELYSAAYNVYSAEQNLKEYQAYPRNSAKYLTAYNNYHTALKNYDDTQAAIQKEVRLNYANMTNLQNQVETASLSVDKAEESYRIYLTKYDLGMVTLSDVRQAQTDLRNAEQSYVKAILSYNLAVLAYEQAATVGTSAN